MEKKQYFLHCFAALAFLGATAFSRAHAQAPQKEKAAPARQAKVKILKQENGEFLLLDTTLTVAEGKSLEEAVKQMEASGTAFRKLGAKPIAPADLAPGQDLKVFRRVPGQGHDSLRVFRFRRALPDSVFSRLKGAARLHDLEMLHPERLKDLEHRVLTITGDSIAFRTSIKVDSLIRGHRFFRLDSAFHVRPDSFLLRETIRVEKDGTGEVKILRESGPGAVELLEEGEYDVIKLRNGKQQDRVIILKATKAPASKKEAAKAAKASRKKGEAKAAKLDVTYSPNPTSGRVNVSFHAQKKAKAQLRVVDSQGKAVFQEDLGTVQGTVSRDLDLSRFGKGVYVVQLQVGNTAQAGKVVVQ
ncbi:T9SS type A sorting domain-containing protein [Rufibacter psychrotolerans]|uniref:T9SS type A sorting domain-containing protein n=1 Tax=Rufibacter psychrotolerans TaxID=2812556 RepID=UPI00196716A4|nr:T9SS type A sorting domain-containing protein [Rufibacter sp. SYSU D00308]